MASPCCPANIRETQFAVGVVAQTDLATPNVVGDLESFTKTNPALSTVTPATESNALDIGKGDEFPTQVFPVSMDVACPIEKYLCSQFAAWMFAFGLGGCTKTGTAPAITYACTPADAAIACLQLPAFSIVEQIRTGASSVADRLLVGNVINDFTLTLESGPGRANARVAVNCVGSGKVVSPSGIVVPPPVTETNLNAAGGHIVINGIDYVLNQTMISVEVRWNNNVRLDTGYYPGSGSQNGFATRGRMEWGDRTCEIVLRARACPGSAEYNALLTMDGGPALIEVTGTAPHKVTLDFPEVMYTSVTNGEAEGIVTIETTLVPIKTAGQPYVTFTAVTDLDNIDPALPLSEEALRRKAA